MATLYICISRRSRLAFLPCRVMAFRCRSQAGGATERLWVVEALPASPHRATASWCASNGHLIYLHLTSLTARLYPLQGGGFPLSQSAGSGGGAAAGGGGASRVAPQGHRQQVR
jgi:hypothetical protein